MFQCSIGPVAGCKRSVDPIPALEVSITRVAITDPEDAKIEISEEGEGTGGKITEMGRKALVPSGIYVAEVVSILSRPRGRPTVHWRGAQERAYEVVEMVGRAVVRVERYSHRILSGHDLSELGQRSRASREVQDHVS